MAGYVCNKHKLSSKYAWLILRILQMCMSLGQDKYATIRREVGATDLVHTFLSDDHL
jgi:hypothetical protein